MALSRHRLTPRHPLAVFGVWFGLVPEKARADPVLYLRQVKNGGYT